jgi:hypothetical protein
VNRLPALAVAFVVTFATVVSGAAVVGFVDGDGAAPAPEIANAHYTDADLVNDRTPGEATIEMSSDAPTQTVVFDPGVEPSTDQPAGPLALLGFGGPEVTARNVRPLANVLLENGHEVRVYTPDSSRPTPTAGPSTGDESSPLGEELANADAFVTFRSDYSAAALDDIESFRESGGHLIVATEPSAGFDAPGAAALDGRLGTTSGPGYVYNMVENDLNYQRVYAEPTGDASLTEGVDRAMFETVTPVDTAATDGDVLRPIEGSQLSTTRAATDAPVLARDDGVVVVGDSDVFVPENTQRVDNDALIGNLADFLVENDREGSRAVTPQAGAPTSTAPVPGETNATQGPSNESTPSPEPRNATSA